MCILLVSVQIHSAIVCACGRSRTPTFFLAEDKTDPAKNISKRCARPACESVAAALRQRSATQPHAEHAHIVGVYAVYAVFCRFGGERNCNCLNFV